MTESRWASAPYLQSRGRRQGRKRERERCWNADDSLSRCNGKALASQTELGMTRQRGVGTRVGSWVCTDCISKASVKAFVIPPLACVECISATLHTHGRCARRASSERLLEGFGGVAGGARRGRSAPHSPRRNSPRTKRFSSGGRCWAPCPVSVFHGREPPQRHERRAPIPSRPKPTPRGALQGETRTPATDSATGKLPSPITAAVSHTSAALSPQERGVEKHLVNEPITEGIVGRLSN